MGLLQEATSANETACAPLLKNAIIHNSVQLETVTVKYVWQKLTEYSVHSLVAPYVCRATVTFVHLSVTCQHMAS
jgi:hypothetical protein